MSSKSSFSNSTSKSYALALYELAKENSELNKAEDEMNGLNTLLSESSDFRGMILNPTVTKEEKNKVIIEMVNQYNFCQTLKKFLSSTSKSYALALYALAKENSELSKVEDGMNGLKTLLSESAGFKKMILNPTVTKEEKN